MRTGYSDHHGCRSAAHPPLHEVTSDRTVLRYCFVECCVASVKRFASAAWLWSSGVSHSASDTAVVLRVAPQFSLCSWAVVGVWSSLPAAKQCALGTHAINANKCMRVLCVCVCAYRNLGSLGADGATAIARLPYAPYKLAASTQKLNAFDRLSALKSEWPTAPKSPAASASDCEWGNQL